MKKHFFFDLEQTMITEWSDPVLCNFDKIQRFIERCEIKEIDIFSFAIWNERDQQHFNKTMKSWLEQQFQVQIVNVWTLDFVRQQITNKTSIRLDTTEFISLWGKRRAFEDFCDIMLEHGSRATLIDDVVPNVTVRNHDKNQTISLINVDRL